MLPYPASKANFNPISASGSTVCINVWAFLALAFPRKDRA